MKKVFLATNNGDKVERYRKLFASAELDVELCTPRDLGIEAIEVVEDGETLAENAEKKARAYFGKVDLPILANDTGFWVEGEGLVSAPKRAALGEKNEAELTQEEIAKHLVEFWKDIARKYGGRVNAAWVEAFVLLDPNGTLHTAKARREVILTETEFGVPHVQMAVRALYISQVTGKPAAEHTAQEELLEMQPVQDALMKILQD